MLQCLQMSSLLDTARNFPKVVVSVNTPTRSARASQCFACSSTLDIVCCFHFSQWGRWVVVSHCGFNLFLSND